jgi:hypothetical protein
MRKLAIVWAALLAFVPAFAEFEGIIEMKMMSSHGNGTVKMSMSKAGVRNDLNIAVPEMPVRMSMLVRFDNPDVAYNINDAAKTYSVMDLKKTRTAARRMGDEAFTVKKLGKETVSGYPCEHVLVTGRKSGETELWTSKDIMDFGSFSKTMGARSPVNPDYENKLREAGADGFPVKSIHRSGQGEDVTLELVKAQKKSLPASLFEVPSGYAKKEGVMGAGPQMPPEAMRSMEENMKNMPPEQREMMEKMMRGQGN